MDDDFRLSETSTFGVTALRQEAEMFIGSREEQYLMLARERYWHDVASIRADYEEQIRAMAAQIASLKEQNSSLLAQNSSLTEEARLLKADNYKQK